MSTHDLAVVLLVVVAFAILATAHVTIVAGLVVRRPRWRAPLAFFLPPVAPYYALRERMRVRGIAWLAALVVYVAALALAST